MAQTVINTLSFSGRAHSPEACLDSFSEEVWERSFPWLDSSGITLYFWQQIKQMGAQGVLPPAVRAGFARRQRENSLRTAAMAEESARLEHLFGTAGGRYAVLKGLAMIPDYCPDPSLRIQFDHDYLVGRDSLERLEKTLLREGYRRKDLRERDRALYVLPLDVPASSSCPAGFYSARLPRPLELHLKLWDTNEEGIALNLPEDQMDRLSIRVRAGHAFPVLRDEDALLFQTLHTFRHILHNWCRLSVLFEIAHFLHLRRGDALFWQRFCTRTDHCRHARRIAGVVFALAASLFKVPSPLPGIPSTSFDLAPELAIWVDRHGTKSAPHNFSANKHSLFLLHAFVRDAATRRKISRRRLFPWHWPHRLRLDREKRAAPAVVAACTRGTLLLRRLWFHLGAALGYAREYPQWQLLMWKTKRKYSGSRWPLRRDSARGEPNGSLRSTGS